MKRSFLPGLGASAVLAAFIGLAIAACDDPNDYGYGTGGGYADCSQYTSCGQCTPVPGCGWCATPSGQGLCARDPNDCASASSFTWTWDTQGCFTPADASVVSVPPADGGGTTTAQDGGHVADGAPSSDAAASPEASTPTADASADAANE